jgi:hypothetical protein
MGRSGAAEHEGRPLIDGRSGALDEARSADDFDHLLRLGLLDPA